MNKHNEQRNAEPFRLTCSPGFAYAHRSYGEAQLAMLGALERGGGLLVVTGRPGTGKTTLAEEIVARLEPDIATATLPGSSHLEGDDLLPSVAYAFGLDATSKCSTILMQELEKTLSRSAGALLIIDEAQNLSRAALEEVRLLAERRVGSRPLLQIFLLGPREFHERLHAPGMERFLNGVAAECTLAPLTVQETHDYVLHRLNCAGGHKKPVITTETFVLIHRSSQGLPRYINAMCTRLLLYMAVEDKDHLGMDDFVLVLEDIDSEMLLPSVPELRPGSCPRLPAIGELSRTKSLPLRRRLDLTEQEQTFISGNPAATQPEPVHSGSSPADAPARTMRSAGDEPAALTPNVLAGANHSEPDNSRYVGYGAAALIMLVASYLMATTNTPPNAIAVARATPTELAAVVTVAVAQPTAVQRSQEPLAEIYPSAPTLEEADPVPQVVHAESVEEDFAGSETAMVEQPEDATNEVIAQLLQLAKQAMARDYLRLSRSESAWSYYQQVLELDPGNSSVGQGLRQIAARYGELSRAQIYRQHYQKALLLIKRGLSIVPDDSGLLQLRTEVNAAQAELLAQREKQPLLAFDTPDQVADPEGTSRGFLTGVKKHFAGRKSSERH